jgi:hypothetical protein
VQLDLFDNPMLLMVLLMRFSSAAHATAQHARQLLIPI